MHEEKLYTTTDINKRVSATLALIAAEQSTSYRVISDLSGCLV